MQNILEVEHLYFSYFRKPVIRDLNMKFSQGVNVIIGENGGGKTTLFKILAGIYQPKDGRLLLNGKDFSKYNDIRRHISYLPQDFYVYPSMKVIDFLKLICAIKGADQSENYLQSIMQMTDLTEFCQSKMKTLSGGMMKRVGIAQALIGDPDIIIADEPTAGLDPEQRLTFNRILQSIASDRIILLSTHIIEDVSSLYNQIIVFSKGAAHFSGTYEELMNSVACVELNEQEIAELNKAYVAHKTVNTTMQEGTVRYRTYIESQTAKQMYAQRLEKTNLLEIWSYYNDQE